MKPIILPRVSWVSVVLMTLTLILHYLLCHPAATCRGFPPIHPFWETLAPILGFLGFLFFPIFDDRFRTRRLIRNIFVPVACFCIAVVHINLQSARPHIGSHLGFLGIVTSSQVIGVVLLTIFYVVFAYPASLILELISCNLWSRIRGFSGQDTDQPALRFSLSALLCLIMMVAVGIASIAWARSLYDSWPGGHWGYRCQRNLRQIAIAMHNYNEDHGQLPPAFLTDESGNAMHSWRVLLLPYLDERRIFEAYRFDEPYDGPNNGLLISRMPSVYACPWDQDSKHGYTSYVVVTGEDTAFPYNRSRRFNDIKDGLSRTILVTERANSGIHWLEPHDIDIDHNKGQLIRGLHWEFTGGYAVFGDGHTAYFDGVTNDSLLRALLTIDGGEDVSWP